jgi:hypothetical protein
VKIQLMSDLHLEGHPGYAPRPALAAELLVLAGDIGSYQRGSQLQEPDFGLARFSPRNGWPVPVLYVPGNHEYDALDFDATHARLRETCERLDITWLEREEHVFGDVRFVGTTLWADFDALPLRPGAPEPALQDVLKQRHKAFRAGATRRWSARSGCGPRSPATSAAPRWSSRTSRRACAAPTRATV